MTIFLTVSLINLAIAIPVFFGTRWALHKFIKSNILLRKVLTWAGTIILTALLYGGFVILVIFYEHYYPSRDFNGATWRADREKRYEMSEDLIKRNILMAKTKDEVQKILGDDFHRYSEDRWVYDIGAKPGFHLESDLLLIDFKNEKVAHVEQFAR